MSYTPYTYRCIHAAYVSGISNKSLSRPMDPGTTDHSDAADREDNGAPSRKALKRKARAEQRAEWKAAQKATDGTTGWVRKGKPFDVGKAIGSRIQHVLGDF